LIEKANAEAIGAEAIKKQVEALDIKIAKATADAEKTRAQASAAEAQATALDLATEAAKNNAGRIDELRQKVVELTAAEVRARVARVEGTGTEEQAKKATDALAVAKGLLKDAINDVSEALDRQIKAMQADVKLAEAGIKLEIERQKNAVISAQLAGNEYAAKQATVKIKELELKLGALSVDQKRAEAEATLKAIAIEEDELRLLGQLTPAKAIELESRRKVQLAAVLEAQAANEAAKAKRTEYEELQKGTPARQAHSKATGEGTTATRNNTTATDGNSSSLGTNERQLRGAAAAQDALTQSRQRYNQVLKESQQYGAGVTDGSGLGGFKDPRLTDLRQPGAPDSPTDKNAPYMGDPQRGIPPDPYGRSLNNIEFLQSQANTSDNSALFALLDKYDKKQIKAEDYAALQSALASAQNNTYQTANSSLSSLRTRDYMAIEQKLRAATEQAMYLTQMAKYPGNTGAFGGYSTNATRTASKTVNVNLNVAGKTVPVTTSSANADQLLKLLTDAQRAAGGP
jgi:hypothetical protein